MNVGVYLFSIYYICAPVPAGDSSSELSYLLEPECPSGVVLGAVLRVVPPSGLPHLVQLPPGLGDRRGEDVLRLDDRVLGGRDVEEQQLDEEVNLLTEHALRADGDRDPHLLEVLLDDLRRLAVLLGEGRAGLVDHRDAVDDQLGAAEGRGEVLVDPLDPVARGDLRVGGLVTRVVRDLRLRAAGDLQTLGLEAPRHPLAATAGEHLDALDPELARDGGLGDRRGVLDGGHGRLLRFGNR